MTPDQLHQLDGPTLTRLAWEWGLAPKDVQYDGITGEYVYGPYVWRPHTHLAQADTVFRMLRPRGWCTLDQYDADPGRHIGQVSAEREDSGMWVVPYRTPAEEAHARLLCAVLAVASEKGLV